MDERSIFLDQILDIKLDIKIGWLLIKFTDNRIEKEYQKSNILQKLSKLKYAFLLILFIYIYIIIGGILRNWPPIFFSFPIIFVIDIFLFFLFLKVDSFKKIFYITYVKYSLIIISFILMIIDGFYQETEIDRMLRIIYCLILTKNFLYVYILETSVIFSIISSLICCCCILTTFFILNSTEKVKLINDMIFEIFVSFANYFMKKYIDMINRSHFVNQYKYENYFNYCGDTIDSMNGFHFSFMGNQLVFLNKNMKNFLTENFGENKEELFLIQYSEQFNREMLKSIKNESITPINCGDLYDKISFENKKENNNQSLNTREKLIIKKNNYDEPINNSIQNNSFLNFNQSSNSKDNLGFFNKKKKLEKLIEKNKNENKYYNVNDEDYYLRTIKNSNIINSKNNKKYYKINMDTKLNSSNNLLLKKKNFNFLDFKYKDDFQNKLNKTPLRTQNLFNRFNDEMKININEFLINLLEINETSKSTTMKEIIKQIIITDKFQDNYDHKISNIALNNIDFMDFNVINSVEYNKKNSNSDVYNFMGQFYFIDRNKTKRYFMAHSRMNKNGKILDIMLNENTEIVKAEKERITQKLKQKMFAKIAHEFKTPLNSIIGLINEIKSDNAELVNNFENSDSDIDCSIPKSSFKTKVLNGKFFRIEEKQLKLIKNLSHYTIYLINDLIQYVSWSDLKDQSNKLTIDDNKSEDLNKTNKNQNISKINVKKQPVKLKKILNFCFDILKSLISCNEINSNYVKPILIFDERLINIKIYTDEIRINQILLNFISNSVKFTKKGSIKIIVDISNSYENKKEIIISVEDEGMGIKEDDKNYIFNKDNIVNENINTNYEVNKMGTGLGLSISFVVAKALNHRIFFSSTYGIGSKFSLGILIDEKLNMPISEYLNYLINNNNIKNKNENIIKNKIEHIVLDRPRTEQKYFKIKNSFIIKQIAKNFKTTCTKKEWNMIKNFIYDESKFKSKIRDFKKNFTKNLTKLKIQEKFYFSDQDIPRLKSKLLKNNLIIFENLHKEIFKFNKSFKPKNDIYPKDKKFYESDTKTLINSSILPLDEKYLKMFIYEDENFPSNIEENKCNKIMRNKTMQKSPVIKYFNEFNMQIKDSKKTKVISKKLARINSSLNLNFIDKKKSNKFLYVQNSNIIGNQITFKEENEKIESERSEKKFNSLKLPNYYHSDSITIDKKINNIILNIKNPDDSRIRINKNFSSKKITEEINSDNLNQNLFINYKILSEFKNYLINSEFNTDEQNVKINFSLSKETHKETKLRKNSKFNPVGKNFLKKKFTFSSDSSNFNDFKNNLNYIDIKDEPLDNQIICNNLEFYPLQNNNLNNLFYRSTKSFNSLYFKGKNNEVISNGNLSEIFHPCINSNKSSNMKREETKFNNVILHNRSLLFNKIDAKNIFLVVDDNKYMRNSLKNVLEKSLKNFQTKLSFFILEGNDGVDIVRFLIEDQIENRIKCILTDENMEYLNGSEAIKIINDLERKRKIKKTFIVSVTSYEDEFMKENILSAGADIIIPKPVSKYDIKCILENLNLL